MNRQLNMTNRNINKADALHAQSCLYGNPFGFLPIAPINVVAGLH